MVGALLMLLPSVVTALSVMGGPGRSPLAKLQDSMSFSSKSMLRVDVGPWSRPPGKGKKCKMIRAHVGKNAREIGSCGVELVDVGSDGLTGGKNERPRAVLSGTLNVSPSFRRQGIAQRLLREAEGQARWMGADEMLLLVQRQNWQALKLYEKMGYQTQPHTKEHGSQVALRKHLYLSPHALPSMVPQTTWIDTEGRL